MSETDSRVPSLVRCESAARLATAGRFAWRAPGRPHVNATAPAGAAGFIGGAAARSTRRRSATPRRESTPQNSGPARSRAMRRAPFPSAARARIRASSSSCVTRSTREARGRDGSGERRERGERPGIAQGCHARERRERSVSSGPLSTGQSTASAPSPCPGSGPYSARQIRGGPAVRCAEGFTIGGPARRGRVPGRARSLPLRSRRLARARSFTASRPGPAAWRRGVPFPPRAQSGRTRRARELHLVPAQKTVECHPRGSVTPRATQRARPPVALRRQKSQGPARRPGSPPSGGATDETRPGGPAPAVQKKAGPARRATPGCKNGYLQTGFCRLSQDRSPAVDTNTETIP